jgi:periplasmic divalent cation tolerance protein
MQFYVFLVTVPNMEEAKRIADKLVSERLAACVNIVRNIISTYRWKGEVEVDEEQLLVIKTSETKVDLIVKKINELHSYEVPECIGFNIVKGSEKYLDWIKESTN